MQLRNVLIIAVLVVGVISSPSKDRNEIAAVSDEFLEELQQRGEAETPTRCSRQLGDRCIANCQCCGADVFCGSYYVGGKE
ncbi:hypothetical protein, partial [Pseudoalteromonas sp. BMB]|uniref:hypothetical protein n=1 Tax=Pseudoalteromonas sp. BMB TaxID=1874619 RepID=UPI001C30F4E0